MISKFVREQKRYTQQDLCSILECTESEVVRNCFLLPTEVDHVIDKGEARMCILENLGLQNIKVRLLPAALAYAHYLSGRKMDIDKLNL